MSNIVEAKDITPKKKAVIAFGRMNPPTKGHKEQIEQMIETADILKADCILYLSHSVDIKKNPLSFEQRKRIIKEMYPDLEVREGSNAITVLQDLSDTYTDIVFMCGADRVDTFSKMVQAYNDKPDRKGNLLYAYDSITVHSSGDRSAADEETGSFTLSASTARKAAAANDFDKFEEIIIVDNPRSAKRIFKEVKKGMAIAESVDLIFNISGKHTLTEARLNTHMTHFEDLVMFGTEGLEELENKIEKILGR